MDKTNAIEEEQLELSELQIARNKILEVANDNRKRSSEFLPKHINEAVCMVRRFRLIDPDVLVTAGFNPRDVHERI